MQQIEFWKVELLNLDGSLLMMGMGPDKSIGLKKKAYHPLSLI